MALHKYLSAKNDYAFKRIFGVEKNKDVLIPFLNTILGFKGEEKIVDVTFITPLQNPEMACAKQSALDVFCHDALGNKYIIEMQVTKMIGFEKRAQYYASRAYTDQMKEGDEYADLKAVIFIAITDFVMFPDKKDYLCNHVILDDKTYERDLKDLSFTFLELPKFHKTIDELDDIIERWTYFFKHAEETNEKDIQRIAGSNPAIQKAFEALNQFNWTDEELYSYRDAEKRQRDALAIVDQKLRDAEEKGKAEGIIEGKLKVAQKLLSSGMSIKQVMELTDLSFQEVEQLNSKR